MMAGAPIKNIRVRQPQTELDLFGVDSATAPMQASPALGNSNETGRATDTTLGPFSLMQDATPTAATAVFKQTHDELGEYFAGERRNVTVPLRAEESRVGKEWVRTCRSGWGPEHKKKK